MHSSCAKDIIEPGGRIADVLANTGGGVAQGAGVADADLVRSGAAM